MLLCNAQRTGRPPGSFRFGCDSLFGSRRQLGGAERPVVDLTGAGWNRMKSCLDVIAQLMQAAWPGENCPLCRLESPAPATATQQLAARRSRQVPR